MQSVNFFIHIISYLYLLYILYCIIYYYLFKEKASRTISNDLQTALGLLIIPFLSAKENNSIRIFIFQSFIFFCLAGALIFFRQAFFRIVKKFHRHRQQRKERDAQNNKKDKRKRYIAIRACALQANRIHTRHKPLASYKKRYLRNKQR